MTIRSERESQGKPKRPAPPPGPAVPEHAPASIEDRLRDQIWASGLLDIVAVIVVALDREGRVRYVNRKACEVLCCRPDQTIGQDWFDTFMPFTIREVARAHFRRLIAGEADPSDYFERPVITRKGEERTIAWSNTVIRDEKGGITHTLSTGEDITDRSRAEEARDASEQKYRALVEHCTEGIGIVQDGRFKLVNRRLVDITGWSEEYLLAKQVTHFVFPEDRPLVQSRREDRLAGGDVESVYPFRIMTGDEQMRWVETHAAVITWEDRPAVLNFFIDITERKAAEARLKESEERYRALFDRSLDMVFTCDLDGNFIDANQAALDAMGYNASEVRFVSMADLLDGDQLSKALAELRRLRETGVQDSPLELTLKARDGRMVVIEAKSALVYRDGKPYAVQGMARDITERKRSEQALQESEKKYRSILEEMADAYFEIDLDGRYTFANRALCRRLGYSEDQIVGVPWQATTASEEIEKTREAFEDLLTERARQQRLVSRVVRRDGSTYYAEIMASLRRNAGGEISGFRLLGRDITERMQAQASLEDSNAALRKALDDAVTAMAKIVETRDPYTYGHQRRVALLCVSIAQDMGLDERTVNHLRTSATVHDLGKMYVPSDILSKPGKLSDVEMKMIRTHARRGYDIVKNIDLAPGIAEAVLQHHERLDGSGYPQGLAGTDITIEARILAVADVVEAMASHRPYREALGVDAALAEIEGKKGVLYDPAAVDACVQLFTKKHFQFVDV